MTSFKKLSAFALALLLLMSVFSACTGSKSGDTTTTTKDSTGNVIDTQKEKYYVDIYTGSWCKNLIQENTFENGALDYYTFESLHNRYTYDDIYRTMRSAVYEPSEFSSELCEVAMLHFSNNEDNEKSYKVFYLYDYKSGVLYCTYNGSWYTVSGYDLLVSDISRLSFSYSYKKYRTYIPSPNEGSREANKQYFSAFSYKRFFALDTGMGHCMYSGFVNSEAQDEITRELAVELAKKEALALDTNITYWDCFYDPYTSYWYVMYSGDNLFIDIYLNENGQTVQISTAPNNVFDYQF